MRKEVILAVIIGVLLGGIILYGINLANNSSYSDLKNNNTNEGKNLVTPPVTVNSSDQIVIIYPTSNMVVTEAQLTLKGSSKPNSNIAIITESDDIITSSDNKGNFSSEINLIIGENLISITAVDEKQATSSATIAIIRTTTFPE